MQVPENLQVALESLASDITPGRLADACAEVSGCYRERKGGTASFADSVAHRIAYAVTRMPAIYAANRRVLREIDDLLPTFEPKVMLDLACGPGTASWAAVEAFPGVAEFLWADSQIELLELGKRLAVEEPVLRKAVIHQTNLLRTDKLPPADLVIFSYGLSEIPVPNREQVARLAWAASSGVLVIVEPGTPKGFEALLQARNVLIESGGNILAPCPHAGTCPMQGTDSWCHFRQRVSRSKRHRAAKRGDMGYEDEKFSYIIASRNPVTSVAPRIVSPPRQTKHSVEVQLCTEDGIRMEAVSRREKANYRRAMKLDWGDRFDLGNDTDGTEPSAEQE